MPLSVHCLGTLLLFSSASALRQHSLFKSLYYVCWYAINKHGVAGVIFNSFIIRICEIHFPGSIKIWVSWNLLTSLVGVRVKPVQHSAHSTHSAFQRSALRPLYPLVPHFLFVLVSEENLLGLVVQVLTGCMPFLSSNHHCQSTVSVLQVKYSKHWSQPQKISPRLSFLHSSRDSWVGPFMPDVRRQYWELWYKMTELNVHQHTVTTSHAT